MLIKCWMFEYLNVQMIQCSNILGLVSPAALYGWTKVDRLNTLLLHVWCMFPISFLFTVLPDWILEGCPFRNFATRTLPFLLEYSLILPPRLSCAHSYSCSQVLLIHSHPFCILQSLLSVHIPNSHSIPEIKLHFRTIYQVMKWPKILHEK